MICKANNLKENTLEVVLPVGSDKIFENVRRVSVKTCDSNLAKFFPEEAFGAEAWIRVEDERPKYDEPLLILVVRPSGECFRDIGWLDSKTKEWNRTYQLADDTVTHWMYLPGFPDFES
jgi:hypothetical protein